MVTEEMLVWQCTPSMHDDSNVFIAEFSWNGPFDHSGYHVYTWKGGWAFSAPKDPILGEFDGRVSDLETAKALCQENYRGRCRLRRWQQHMINNEPPEA